MTNAEIHTLAAPYALHALPEDEAESFEAHLAECPACRTEVDEIRETTAKLGIATAVAPPAEMKEQVLARIREVRPLPPQRGRHAAAYPDDELALGSSGTARDRARRAWWPKVATGLVAAMAAGIVALTVQLVQTRDELDESLAVGAQMQEMVAAPDLEMVRAEAGDSHGTVLVARSLDTAVLVAAGMPPAPAEHTYQLWFMSDDGPPRSAGLLTDVAADGEGGPFTAGGLEDAGQLGITVEPTGGSEQPTTDPVMVIELPA